MSNLLSQFWQWLSSLWSKPVPAKELPQKHRHVLIIAFDYPQAREWALRHLPYHEDWRYVREADQLYGYRNVKIVKLDGWAVRKDKRFIQALRRLEAGL